MLNCTESITSVLHPDPIRSIELLLFHIPHFQFQETLPAFTMLEDQFTQHTVNDKK